MLRVLIADDDRDVATTLGFLLSDKGYEVRAAYDGDQAVLLLADFDPDIVIADIQMPKRSGWEIANWVRKGGKTERPLMVAVSGQYKKGSDKILSQIAGFDYFFAKPVDPQTLIGILGRYGDPLLRALGSQPPIS